MSINSVLLDYVFRFTCRTVLVLAFFCAYVQSANSQNRPWPYPLNIATNDAVNATVAARFGKNARLLSGSFGQIKESVQRGWVGVVEIPSVKNRHSVQVLILSEIDFQAKYKIEALSRKVNLPACFDNDSCIIEVETSHLPVSNPIKIAWWTLSDDDKGTNIRTTFYPVFQKGRWKVNYLQREDWDEQGLNMAVSLSPSGRRSFSIHGDNGRTISGRNRPPFEQLFENFNPLQHWPEKASDF